MKIVVSANGKEKTNELDGRFGRCSYFQIYDSETNSYSAVENKGVTSAHGAGIAAAQQVVDCGASAVITGRVGPNALRVLQDSNVKILNFNGGTVEEAVAAYKDGKVSEINGAGPAHAGI